MQFLVIAYDGTDDLALARRLAVREKHLEGWLPTGTASPAARSSTMTAT